MSLIRNRCTEPTLTGGAEPVRNVSMILRQRVSEFYGASGVAWIGCAQVA